MAPPLATLTDALRFGYTLPDTEQNLLDRASVRVRSYTRQTISRVTNDVVTLRPLDGSVRLPQRPADKPTAVTADDGFGNIVTVPTWAWNGRRVICPHRIPRNQWDGYDWWVYPSASLWRLSVCLCTAKLASVTYSHGFTTIPDEVLDVVCSVAARIAATTAGMEFGVRGEQIGDYSVTYAADALGTASGLLPGEKETLDRIFGRSKASTIPMT